VLYVADTAQALFIGKSRLVVCLSKSEDRIAVIKHAAAMKIIFLENLARELGADLFEAVGKFGKLFCVKAELFLGLDCHVKNIIEFTASGATERSR
jgi:hypothetical protein